MKISIPVFIVSFSMGATSFAGHHGGCPRKDDQAELATTCEKVISTQSMRIECLSSARKVATIEFCTRQFSAGARIVECIEKIDSKVE